MGSRTLETIRPRVVRASTLRLEHRDQEPYTAADDGSGSPASASALENLGHQIREAVERLEGEVLKQAEALEALEQFELNKIRYELQQTKAEVATTCRQVKDMNESRTNELESYV